MSAVACAAAASLSARGQADLGICVAASRCYCFGWSAAGEHSSSSKWLKHWLFCQLTSFRGRAVVPCWASGVAMHDTHCNLRSLDTCCRPSATSAFTSALCCCRVRKAAGVMAYGRVDNKDAFMHQSADVSSFIAARNRHRPAADATRQFVAPAEPAYKCQRTHTGAILSVRQRHMQLACVVRSSTWLKEQCAAPLQRCLPFIGKSSLATACLAAF